MSDEEKSYDLILFGVTGFTGRLCVEYLLQQSYDISWAACARNQAKAEKVLKEIADNVEKEPPPLLIADLVCSSDEDEARLRKVVQRTRVVLTCSGPFEKYGQTLVKVCAELGIHYADITGETDFFRQMIHKYDATAIKNDALILCHCGNDCIPQDLAVYEMHQYAKSKGKQLVQVSTVSEFSEATNASGGTVATATFQLNKDRSQRTTDFDPLLQAPDGSKSEFSTKNLSPKTVVKDEELNCQVGPWIMAPVMVNCVRRSNALIQYNKEFKYSDAEMKSSSLSGWVKQTARNALIGAAIYMPSLFGGLAPKPGEGPSREDMERGYLKLHARGTMVDPQTGTESKLKCLFQFNKDIAYLYTAALLVETGMVLHEKKASLKGGVKTAAAGLGSDLTQRILDKIDVSLEIAEM